jgi:hypothetical protein
VAQAGRLLEQVRGLIRAGDPDPRRGEEHLGDCQVEPIRLPYNRRLRFRHDSVRVTCAAGLLACRNLDTLQLTRTITCQPYPTSFPNGGFP